MLSKSSTTTFCIFGTDMAYQFVTTSNPSQGISTEARSHVMKTYLRKKQFEIRSDLWASSERNRTQSHVAKLRQRKVAKADQVQISTTQGSPVSSETYPRGAHALAIVGSGSGHQGQNFSDLAQFVHQNQRAHKDIIVAYLNELMAAFKNVKPQRCLGSEIDPFHTLPQISSSGINIERLKKHCQCFQELP
jgi:hypothetical protein